MPSSGSKVVYVDYSMLSTFSTCEEKYRLSYEKCLRPLIESPALSFGKSFHKAIASYYTNNNREEAKHVFLREARLSLPLSSDDGERRSIDRGLSILDAYFTKWEAQDAQYENVLRPDTNKPYIEMGFAAYFMLWNPDTSVVCVGAIDRLRRSRIDNQVYVFETKTTSSGINSYVSQIRPNHQLTTYYWACRELLGMQVAGVILDVIHVSDRKMEGKFPTGVDVNKDFGRFETRRSPRDVDEFLFDLELTTADLLRRKDSDLKRWRRNAPTACHMYGGCQFRNVCAHNLNPRIIESEFRVEKWEPWKGIVEEVATNKP